VYPGIGFTCFGVNPGVVADLDFVENGLFWPEREDAAVIRKNITERKSIRFFIRVEFVCDCSFGILKLSFLVRIYICSREAAMNSNYG
jgi:hypothetical protein